MTISLVNSRPLAVDWFEHAAHHPPQTPIQSVIK